jgi:tetratricopeptide (TPR) repeat protein
MFSRHHSPPLTTRTPRWGLPFVLISPSIVCVVVCMAACSGVRSVETAQTTQQNSRAELNQVSTPLPSASRVKPNGTTPNAAVVEMLTPNRPPDYMKPGKARDYFIRGATAQNQEKWAEAILEYQQALRYDTSAVMYFVIAQCYTRLGKTDLAQENAVMAMKLDSTFLPPYKLVAETYMAQYRLDDAISIYSYITDKEPDLQNRFTLARLYEMRDVNKAVEIYSSVLDEMGKDDPNEYVILGRLVELQAKQGKPELATRALERLYQKYPQSSNYIRALLEAYNWQKQFDKGFTLLTESEASIPEQESIMLALSYGEALVQQFDSVKQVREYARRFLSRAESRTKSGFSTSAPYQMLCGMLALHLDNEPQSRFYFDRAVALSDSAAVPLQISMFYFQKQRVRDMAEFASQSAVRFPREARLPYMAGFGFSQLDSAKRAIQELRKAVAIDGKFIDAWAQLGMLYSSTGQVMLSDSAYERALEIDPENALVNNNYAYSFSERNINLDRAEKMTLTALKAEPTNASYLDTMGWIYYQQGKHAKALEYISQAIENGEVSAAVYEHLGDVYNKLGNIPKAIEAWKQALKKDPNRASAKNRIATVLQR